MKASRAASNNRNNNSARDKFYLVEEYLNVHQYTLSDFCDQARALYDSIKTNYQPELLDHRDEVTRLTRMRWMPIPMRAYNPQIPVLICCCSSGPSDCCVKKASGCFKAPDAAILPQPLAQNKNKVKKVVNEEGRRRQSSSTLNSPQDILCRELDAQRLPQPTIPEQVNCSNFSSCHTDLDDSKASRPSRRDEASSPSRRDEASSPSRRDEAEKKSCPDLAFEKNKDKLMSFQQTCKAPPEPEPQTAEPPNTDFSDPCWDKYKQHSCSGLDVDDCQCNEPTIFEKMQEVKVLDFNPSFDISLVDQLSNIWTGILYHQCPECDKCPSPEPPEKVPFIHGDYACQRGKLACEELQCDNYEGATLLDFVKPPKKDEICCCCQKG